MGTVPASASEALEMVRAGLGWLAAADATALGAETQARCRQQASGRWDIPDPSRS